MSLIRRNVSTITVIPVATDGSYATGQVIGAVNTVANAVLDDKAACELRSVVVLDAANQKQAIDLVFFNEAPATTIGADGASYALDDTDLLKVIGRVTIGTADYVSSGSNNAEATIRNIGLMLQSIRGKHDVYVAVIARGTINLGAATDLSFKLALERF